MPHTLNKLKPKMCGEAALSPGGWAWRIADFRSQTSSTRTGFEGGAEQGDEELEQEKVQLEAEGDAERRGRIQTQKTDQRSTRSLKSRAANCIIFK